MKNYFRYMACGAGRFIRAVIEFTILAWGYSNYQYPLNLTLIVIGTAVLSLALLDICLLAHCLGILLLAGILLKSTAR